MRAGGGKRGWVVAVLRFEKSTLPPGAGCPSTADGAARRGLGGVCPPLATDARERPPPSLLVVFIADGRLVRGPVLVMKSRLFTSLLVWPRLPMPSLPPGPTPPTPMVEPVELEPAVTVLWVSAPELSPERGRDLTLVCFKARSDHWVALVP